MNEDDTSRAAEEHRLRMQRRKTRIDARVAAATEDRGVVFDSMRRRGEVVSKVDPTCISKAPPPRR